MIYKDITLAELVQLVNEALDDVETGEEFIVKDLFRGFEWNRIPKSLRTKLGSMILVLSQGNNLSQNITAVRKTPQNQQIYVKN